jgi:hypothetical protein
MQTHHKFKSVASTLLMCGLLAACGGGESESAQKVANADVSVSGKRMIADDAPTETLEPTQLRRPNSNLRGWESRPTAVVEQVGSIHRVATDAAGNAMLVYTTFSNGYYNLMAKLYSAATQSWGQPIALEEMPNDVKGVWLASNASGQAVVTWTQGDQVFSNLFDRSRLRFSGAQRVDNLPGQSLASCNTMDSQGNVTVAFLNTATPNVPGTAYTNDFYAVRYDARNGWETTPTLLEQSDLAAYGGKCVVDDGGKVTVAWTQRTKYSTFEPVDSIDPITGDPIVVIVEVIQGYETALYSNQYMPAGLAVNPGWAATATTVAGSFISGSHFLHDMAANGKGDILLSFQNNNGAFVVSASDNAASTEPVMWGSQYDTAMLESRTVQRSHVALDQRGSAVVLWMHDGALYSKKFTRTDYRTSGWSEKQQLPNKPFGAVQGNGAISLAMNQDGQALLAYNSGPNSVIARTFSLALNLWSEPQLMRTATAASSFGRDAVNTSINAAGKGVVTWEQDSTLFTNFYTTP